MPEEFFAFKYSHRIKNYAGISYVAVRLLRTIFSGCHTRGMGLLLIVLTK